MITRCPECSTLFKVVADQLKISDGWVRCGQCGQVFDGGANLQSESQVAASTSAIVGAHKTDSDAADVRNVSFNASQTVAAEDAGSVQRETVTRIEPQFEGLSFSALVPGGVPGIPDRDTHVPNTGAAQIRPAQMSAVRDLTGSEASFIQTARPEPRSRRGLLALSAAVLLLGLAFQGVVFERDRIAATLPQTRPWLQSFCQTMACAIEPLKNVDAITIDSSSFKRLRGDVYRLQVSLKNAARTELALPSVELTLTDTNDAAVVRRVLLPTDFSAAARSIAAGADWSGALTVSVAGAANPSRIAGYRVLAFYP